MISIGIDATLFMQIIQFLIIVAVVNFLILKPIRGAMDKRASKISALLDDADSYRLSIDAQKKKYDEKMKALRTELAEYHLKVQSEAAGVAKQLIDEVKDAVSKELELSRLSIKKETEATRLKLKDNADEFSNQIIKVVMDKTA